MITTIILDSWPLSLIVHKPGATEADAARAWLKTRLQQSVQFYVPEIIDYELRRELLRAGKRVSLRELDHFIGAVSGRLIELNRSAIRLAAELWAQSRKQGLSTAHSQHLDIDVILAAQTLDMAFAPGQFVVATSNVKHLTRFVPADEWTKL